MRKAPSVDQVPANPLVDVTPGTPERAGIIELQAALQEERDRHLRTRADLENYRRRVERDRDLAVRQAKRDLLLALVELADGFDRALVHIDDSPGSVTVGLQGMLRRLGSLLEAEGVRSFESVGEQFDPNRHEAVATVRDSASARGTVVDEAARGYFWNETLLRAARVRVAE